MKKTPACRDADIRNTFHKPVKMKVFAWNSTREKDTVMSPLDSIKYNRQMLQTGFMVMDPFTGAVKAWVGGIDFKTYKFDHVNINTKRQVGSSIKPFLYSLGIEDFNFTPATVCQTSQQFFPEYNAYVPAKSGLARKPRHHNHGLWPRLVDQRSRRLYHEISSAPGPSASPNLSNRSGSRPQIDPIHPWPSAPANFPSMK